MCRCKLLIPHLKIPAFSTGGEFVTLLKTSYLDKVVKNWSHPKFGYWGEPKPQRFFDSGSACWSQRGRIDRILLANSAEQMQMELWGLNCTYNSLQGAFRCYIFELWSAWLCLEPVIWKHPPGADPVLGCTRVSCAQGKDVGPGAVLSPGGARSQVLLSGIMQLVGTCRSKGG